MFSSVYIALVSIQAATLVSGIINNCPYQICECFDDIINCDVDTLQKLPPLRAINITKPLYLYFIGNQLTNVPAGGLPFPLSGIDFQENPIATIDKEAFIGSADTLTELLFSEAMFTELPEAVLCLNVLKNLTISDTLIKMWNTATIKHLGATLETLILRNVGLTSWPTWIQYLPHLGTLELSNASIFVPDNAFDRQINTLFSLNLQNGILTEIPSAASKLTKLQYLFMDNNNISRVNGIPASPVLSKVSLNNNKISDARQLSDTLRSVAGSLVELSLTNNHLTYLPDFSAMIKLETLYLSYNIISYIGTSKISSFLKELKIDQNHLQSLDSFMRGGLNLTVLKVQNNFINEMVGVDIPVSVQDMDISYNLLAELTDESFPLNSSCESLSLDSNPITKVSSMAFSRLTKLTFLTMRFTKITRLPLSLTSLSSVRRIDVSRNSDMICTCTEKAVLLWCQVHHVVINGECGVLSIYDFMIIMSGQCPP